MKMIKLLLVTCFVLVVVVSVRYFYSSHQEEAQRNDAIKKSNEEIRKQLENPWGD